LLGIYIVLLSHSDLLSGAENWRERVLLKTMLLHCLTSIFQPVWLEKPYR